jgi:hypothetical protein
MNCRCFEKIHSKEYVADIPQKEYEEDVTNAICCFACKTDVEMYERMLEAIELFCRRVEMGEIRSKNTYSEFKGILATINRRKE